MRLLVLGGTVFLGRHLVEAARRAGHQVTLFNRGKTHPELFPDLEKLRGDRRGDLRALEGRQWDAVIDTSGYRPSVVRRSAQLLAGSAGHYTYFSTISVYQDPTQAGHDERAPVAVLADDNEREVTPDTYGPLQALCEQAAAEAFDGEVLVLRPGLIVGPHDPTDRFSYWPRRMARGGEVLAPGDPERPVQLIDVRDLTSWAIESIAAQRAGTFNVTGPAEPLTMEAALKACVAAAKSEVELTWIEEAFLLDAGVRPFTELPLWLPQSQNGMLEVNVDKAIGAGLRFRPLVDTACDTLAWDQQRGARLHRGPAIGPARELALLEAWHARQET